MEVENGFKDRKGALTFFGIIEILIGAFFLMIFLMALLSLTSLANSNINQNPQISFWSVILTSIIYLVFSAVFITLGIGSIKTKSWARSLTLLLSWFTLIIGLVIIFAFALFADSIFQRMLLSVSYGDNSIQIIKVIIYLIFGIFFIAIPGVFILFYRSSNVKKTVQKYDLKENWFSKIPLPVLALSFIFFYISITPLYYIFSSWVIPLLGFYIYGFPAVILYLLNSAICIYLGVKVYRMQHNAWICSLYYYSFWIISAIITFSVRGFYNMYKYTDLTQEQIALMKNTGITNTSFLVFFILANILFFSFLIYTKKYFNSNNSDDDELIAN